MAKSRAPAPLAASLPPPARGGSLSAESASGRARALLPAARPGAACGAERSAPERRRRRRRLKDGEGAERASERSREEKRRGERGEERRGGPPRREEGSAPGREALSGRLEAAAARAAAAAPERDTLGSVELRFQEPEPERGARSGGVRSKMRKVAAFACVWAAAWCSQAVAAAAAAAAAAGAGGRSDSGNFLDDKQWLTTISQYDKEVGQWNKFRDEVEDDYFRTWSPPRPFDQALDPAKDPCLKMKCSRHKVCVAQDQQTAVCISHRRLTHSMKEAGLRHKQWKVGPVSSKCKQCPVVYTNPVCGSDGHTYSSQCKLEYQACVSGKQISVKCEGRCPCPSDKSTSAGRNDRRVCSDLEFREVANRLRDWFKALHESGIQKRTRTVQRPERSRFDTSILPICKDSLGWMFNRLDTNYDLLLDQSELGSIYLDKNEQCTKAFFNSCDTYKDSLISNNEWCYCFQRQQDPPCQTELSNIQKQQGGKKLLGQYIPLCDEDGYYKSTQCHGSAGQCWCVDRYGNEVTGSRTHGAADCAIDLETSGDFASGDFHEWTDDEDDDMMNDEDEIEDDDEDEDDDDDDDHEGYI